jgi:amino acid transporter
MTDSSATARAAGNLPPVSETKLQANAISTAQGTIIGMASSAPAATVGLSFAALVAATAYGSLPILLLTGALMLIIANAYRRLNLWKANTGASFEWVGRAINPYLGFLTGWLMIAAYIIGTVAEILLLGPSVVAVVGANPSTAANVIIGIVLGLIMLVIAVVGIKLTARVQVTIALIEYLILIGMAIWGLVYVLGHHHGTVPVTSGWFSLSGIDGKGSAIAGFLVAVFVFGGWDGTLYVNEEIVGRRHNPGLAAVIAVALLTVVYSLSQIGFQGVLSPGKLAAAAENGTALIAVADALGGGFWAKVMALAIALSVVATTGTGIVLTSRIVYGMSSHRVLPGFLGSVSPRYHTPVAASVIVGVLMIALSTIYFLATSVENAFDNVIAVTGLLFSIFYIMTALAAITYYRRRILSNAWDFVIVGVLSLAASGFLGYVFIKSWIAAPSVQRWSLIGIVIAGLILMLVARFVFRSAFFGLPLESADKNADNDS